ncbi:MAG TPA: serine/threonine-protein kinase [Acidimicrobiales bacterium]|nr:serine/threonine-protein kinase [Acidimicrobiales bacterium]
MVSPVHPPVLGGDQAPEPEGTGGDQVAGAPVALPAGTTLGDGRYRLGEVLGRGGFGITYAATDERLRRPVAVKELFPDGAGRRGLEVRVAEGAEAGFARARERFLREATTLARFGHPGIVRIWGAMEENGTAYLVLERLRGHTLAQELRARRGPFSQAEALHVAEQVAAALAVVHRAGVLHRDVSPANLVRTDDGRVVLIDFGLARPFAADRTTSMTRIVTPGYGSPEQYEGSARFGPRSDVYALGATLYRLVTGHAPAGAVDRARDDDLVPAWRLNPSVSRPVSDALAAAVALDPDRRPPSVGDLLARLGLDPDAPGEAAARRPALDDPPTVLDPQVLDPRASPTTVTIVDPPPRRPGAAIPGPAASSPGPPPAARHRAVVPAPAAPAGPPVPSWEPLPPVAAPVPVAPGVGAPPRGRGWVTLPLGLAAVALASAQPVTVTLALAVGVAPALATVGDRLVRPHRSLAWAPGWWARNVAVGLVRGLGAAGILGVGLCLWYGTELFDGAAGAGSWVLRATGVGAGWVLASSIGRGGPGFRSHVALDALATRLLPRGRLTPVAAVVVAVCLLVAAAGAWFRPEAWPLGG